MAESQTAIKKRVSWQKNAKEQFDSLKKREKFLDQSTKAAFNSDMALRVASKVNLLSDIYTTNYTSIMISETRVDMQRTFLSRQNNSKVANSTMRIARELRAN